MNMQQKYKVVYEKKAHCKWSTGYFSFVGFVSIPTLIKQDDVCVCVSDIHAFITAEGKQKYEWWYSLVSDS